MIVVTNPIAPVVVALGGAVVILLALGVAVEWLASRRRWW